MKRFFVSCLLAGLVAAGTACAADPEPKAAEMKTDDDKTFYALCEHMLPGYHQVEFDTRLYLTLRALDQSAAAIRPPR